MISIDSLFGRAYHLDNYNCAHFVADAWLHITGHDMAGRLKGWLCAVSDKQFIREDIRQFKRLSEPESPCIVLFQAKNKSPHIGLFYCGKVLHLTVDEGVQFMPLEVVRVGFNRVRYYK